MGEEGMKREKERKNRGSEEVLVGKPSGSFHALQ